MALGLAAGAGLAVQAPRLFGLHFDTHPGFYLRNASLFVLPFLAAYLFWKRKPTRVVRAGLAGAFLLAAVFANLYPFHSRSDTQILTALHLPIALWLVLGWAYVGGRWRGYGGRMDFVRFSGELAIYYVLLALGGGVLTALTVNLFGAIGHDARWLAEDWVIPSGAAGAVIVSCWLVETKRQVTGHVAPLLTRVFTPLLAVFLMALLGTMAWTWSGVTLKREVLILLDVLLAIVVALLLYGASAREPDAPPGWFDRMQLVLVFSALAVDFLALVAIANRVSEFGLSPNRVAALGENLVLLGHLVGGAWFGGRFVLGRDSFGAAERWHLAYLPVYAGWAGAVVVLFPPVFGYR